MMNRVVISVVTVFGLTCLNSYGQDQYLELGAGFRQGDFGISQNDSRLAFFQASYGLIKKTYDLGVSFQYLKFDDGLTKESGLGDIYISTGHRQMIGKSQNDLLRISGAIKLPTADETQGLGTGEIDYGLFAGYTHNNKELTWIFTGGYIINGDPPGVDFSNVFFYGVTAAKNFGRSYASLGLEGGQQALAAGDDPLALVGDFFRQLSRQQFLRFTCLFGISEASPDVGFTISVVNWF